MPDAPPHPEVRGCRRRALTPGGDERRDSRDVVGVGRVPKAEQHRDEEHDRDRRPVRQPCDPLVHARTSPHPPWSMMSMRVVRRAGIRFGNVAVRRRREGPSR